MSSQVDAGSTQELSQNKQGSLRTSNIAIVMLATFFVALRFFTRWKAGVKYGLDDYTLLVALGILFGLLAIGLEMIHHGLGMHAAALEYSSIIDILKLLLAFECVYVITVATIKISLLLMYRRAFDIRSLRIQTYILGGIVVAWAIAICCVCIFQCDNIPKAWNPTLNGRCLDLKGSFIGNAVPNIITDVLILTLPIRHVWKLVPSLALRLQLSCVFLLGSLVLAASIYRFSTLFAFVPSDTPWTLATPCNWCIIECSIGIVSVCLPTLGPLLQLTTCISLPSQRSPGYSSKSNNSKSRGKTSNTTTRSSTMGGLDLTYGKALGEGALIAARSRSFDRLSSVGSLGAATDDDRRDLEMGELKCEIGNMCASCGDGVWRAEQRHPQRSGEVRFSSLMLRDISGREMRHGCVSCGK